MGSWALVGVICVAGDPGVESFLGLEVCCWDGELVWGYETCCA